MAEGRRYYWLKLKEDFFLSKRIKKLRNMAGGDTYTIIYLKLQLKAMRSDGVLRWDHLEDNIADELALDLDENPDDVRATLIYLSSCGLAESSDDSSFYFPYAVENVGSESSSAARVKAFRDKNNGKLEAPQREAKSNAERQRSFRAKQKCEERHIPLIEDYVNNKRYNGNYYLVMQRDRYQCAMCGSTDNLCVHHIDGYDENKSENSDLNRMIVLCRTCHGGVHRSGIVIPQDLLDSIGYERNESNVTCNACVTQVKRIGNGEIEIEKEKEQEQEEVGGDTLGLSDDEAQRIALDHSEILDAAEAAGFPKNQATWNKILELYAEFGKETVLAGISACVDQTVTKPAYLRKCCQNIANGEGKAETDPLLPKDHVFMGW